MADHLERETVELSEYVAALRKRWFVVVVLAVLGGAVGYTYSHSQTPLYRSTSEVFVSLSQGDTVGDLVQGSTYTRNLVESYVALATKPIVLDPVISELRLNTTAAALGRVVDAQSPLDTMIIQITVTDPSPTRAAAIANSVSSHLATAVTKVSPKTSDGNATVVLTTISTAIAPQYAFAPNTKRTAATGGALGLLLGVIVALLLVRLDTRVRTTRDLPGKPERTLLGAVPVEPLLGSAGARLIVQNPHGLLAEAYRRIRTNVEFLDVDDPTRALVLTSAVPGEGKSTTAVNLALMWAEKGKRVLLVDADLRRPSIARNLGLVSAAGLSTVLVGEATLADVVQHWGPTGLAVLTSGVVPPNPGRLVDSDAMTRLIQTAVAEYDLVVFDSPPLLAVSDAAVLARHTDGAIVVAGASVVRKRDLSDALSTLDMIGAVCLGVVLNRVKSADQPHYYYRYDSRGPGGRRKRRRRDRPAVPAEEFGPAVTELAPTPVHGTGVVSDAARGAAREPTVAGSQDATSRGGDLTGRR